MRRCIITALIFCVILMEAQPAKAGNKNMICRGEIGNAYLPQNLKYKIFSQRTFYLTTQCSWWVENVIGDGECDYLFNGSRHKGYLYRNGDFRLRSLGALAAMSQGGYLSFKVSEETNGVIGNEGQRWFQGHCEITN